MLYTYECNFYVNGKRTKEIVNAQSQSDAKGLVEMKFSNCRINWVESPQRK